MNTISEQCFKVVPLFRDTSLKPWSKENITKNWITFHAVMAERTKVKSVMFEHTVNYGESMKSNITDPMWWRKKNTANYLE